MTIWSAEIKEIEDLYYSLKDCLPNLEKELDRLIKTDDENMVLVYARRCLEVILTNLCESELNRPRKTEPLKGIIDKLNREEKVPSHIIASMHSLNSLSTFGAHPKEFDPEQVRSVLINLVTIFKWYLKFKNAEIYPAAEKKKKEKDINTFEDKYPLPGSGTFLDYKGPVDINTIELLLKKLKKTQEFADLNKTTGRRVYAIFVECLENISKHSLKKSENDELKDPYVIIKKQKDEIIIATGNSVSDDNEIKIKKRLSQIIKLDEAALKTLYDEKINRELDQDKNGAGLGFIIMALKSGNRIKYSFARLNNSYSFFEIQISVINYLIRTLIIKETDCTPRVILDPHKNTFEISGESRPHDVSKFYPDILKWLDDFDRQLAKQIKVPDPIVFNFNFEYFNSSSAKYILDFCRNLVNLHARGINITVKWHYEEDDEDMLETGSIIIFLSG
jgi:hypothetical protein